MEKKLQYDAEERGVLSSHRDAYEYVYIFRCTLNTSMALLSRCMPPKIKLVKTLYSDLEKKYPHWQDNEYYLANYSKEERKQHLMILKHPLRSATLSMIWKLNAFRRNFMKKVSK